MLFCTIFYRNLKCTNYLCKACTFSGDERWGDFS
uniref:Uncharacterized protein n=1 Tax=Anguilla anguilla TaxID=7936 RepID=A0A0E9W022_ANGAN